MEPVKLFEFNESEITSPAPEQVSPVHTGDEHLLATLEQFQAGILDWMLVEVIMAHKAVSSPAAAASRRDGGARR
jgi:hypothetical protein